MSPSLVQSLGLTVPLVQAPMAGTSTPALAAAVSNAGALGSLGIAALNADQARAVILDTRARTDRPFNVNVFCHQPALRDDAREAAWLRHLAPLFTGLGGEVPSTLREGYTSYPNDEATQRMLLETRPAVVSFHFGLPAHEWIAALRDAGIVTIATATNLQEAQAIEAAGVDAIVAQGIEAGGHRGVFDVDAPDEQLSTLVLTRLLVTHTSLPIIAAGGIMDGRGVRAALAAGAVAAQLGTAFVTCPESAASEAYRANLVSDRATRTLVTRAISGRPARGLVNRFIEWCEMPGSPVSPSYPLPFDAAKQLFALAAASEAGREFAAHWAGQGAPLVRPMPAADLVRLLDEELRASA